MLGTKTRPAILSAVLAAAALGYATGGADGSAAAATAVALGVGVVVGLAWTIEASVGSPTRTKTVPTLVSAVAVAGWTVASASVLDAVVPTWAFLGAVPLVGVLLGIACESPAGGLWHGAVAGGTGGVLFVYVAIYESLTMQPELDAIVLLAGILAPLAFAVAGGIGGAVGASTLEAVWTKRVSE